MGGALENTENGVASAEGKAMTKLFAAISLAASCWAQTLTVSCPAPGYWVLA